MIISTKKGTPKEELEKIVDKFEKQGLDVTLITGKDYNVFGLVGDTTKIDERDVLANPWIDNVTRVSAPYKRANRLFHPADSVIDCGGAEDASGETAARYLLARGMPRVDRLILTHFDADHCNGVRQLLRRVQVDTLYIPELSPSSRLRTQILLAAAEAGTSIRYVTQDLVLPQEGGSLTIFAPTGEKDEENAGLCVLAACEKYDILITGDLTAQAEYRLLSLHTLPQAAVLVAGHHGAATSTSGALLRAGRPEAVFISAGADNRFGHPAAQTLARIRQSGAAVYRTDLSGTITIRG